MTGGLYEYVILNEVASYQGVKCRNSHNLGNFIPQLVPLIMDDGTKHTVPHKSGMAVPPCYGRDLPYATSFPDQ